MRERKLMSLEQMIYKITGLPSKTYGLDTKGSIKDGMDADLVLFEEKSIGDAADFSHSNRLSHGIRQVIVSGKVVYENQQMTGCVPGKWITFKKMNRKW